MTIRSLILVTVFAGALAATGCVTKEDTPEVVGPPAPKTTAELLVGKWSLIETDARLPEGFRAKIEFGSDGL